MAALSRLLDLSGIGSGRLWLRWVSSAEGKLFAEYAGEVTRAIEELGPFDPGAWRLPLAAVKRVLADTQVRWLTGKERDLEEAGNVYGEKISPERYRELLDQTIERSLAKALVQESLSGDGQKVREIAEKTGLAVPVVSACLVELEQADLAAIEGYEDRHPRFVAAA